MGIRVEITGLKKKFGLNSGATVGYVVIILSAAFTGLTNTFAKPLLDIQGVGALEISPITLAAVIYLINGVFFTPLTRKSAPAKTIGKRNMLFLIIIGTSEVAALITYFFGLKESTAVHASILSEGEMIFSLLIAITILRERLQRKEITPFAMIIVGMIIIPVGFDLHQNGVAFTGLVFGDMLIILSGLFYALDINLCKTLSRKMDSKRLIQITSFVSGGVGIALVFFFGIPLNIDFAQIPSIVFLSIVGTGLASVFFIIALRLIGAVRTLLLYSSSSAFGVIFSGMFLGESISVANAVSIILVIAGIYFLRNRLAEDCEDEKSTDKLKYSHKSEKMGWVSLSSLSQNNKISINELQHSSNSLRKTTKIYSNLKKKYNGFHIWKSRKVILSSSGNFNSTLCHIGVGLVLFKKNSSNSFQSKPNEKKLKKKLDSFGK